MWRRQVELAGDEAIAGFVLDWRALVTSETSTARVAAKLVKKLVAGLS